MGDERMQIESQEIDLFLGNNYLLSIHEHPSETIDALWESGEAHHQRRLAQGPAMLLYELIDRQLDRYMPIFDAFESRVEQLGDLIFMRKLHNDTQLMDEILTAKTTALRLRRTLIPQLNVLEKLARTDFDVIPSDSRRYFQDVYDHVLRLSSLAENMRDLVNSTATIHLTVASHRLNEIMKVLTVIATIFMPLSFIAGVYGMNFEQMPELAWPWMYPFVWLIFLAIAGTMLYFFRRRQWL
jgi:magnesium transporter